jgi:hypothetical protein
MPEEPPIAPDPVVIPGQDPAPPPPWLEEPQPALPPEIGGDAPPMEMPDYSQ